LEEILAIVKFVVDAEKKEQCLFATSFTGACYDRCLQDAAWRRAKGMTT